jgi:hypothetical protein
METGLKSVDFFGGTLETVRSKEIHPGYGKKIVLGSRAKKKGCKLTANS